jgi:hypothetical protein
VRRRLRPLVITLVSLALALGASVGLAAPAGATTDVGFTVQIDPTALPLVSDSGDLLLGGTKTASSVLTTFDTTDGSGVDLCDGLDAGSTAWSCNFYPPEGGWVQGGYSMAISETNADGTIAHNVLSYSITDGEAPNTPTSPIDSLSFVPGGVQVTTTVSQGSGDTVVGTQTRIAEGEGSAPGPSCAADVSDNPPLGSELDAASQQTCTLSYADESPVLVHSVQGTFCDGPCPDGETDAYFYVPQQSASITSVVINKATQTVAVSGTAGVQATDEAENAATIQILGDNYVPVCTVAPGSFTLDPASTVDVSLYDWSCTTSALGYGSHTLNAVVEDLGELGDGYFGGYQNAAYLTGGLSSPVGVGTINFVAPKAPAGPTGDITPVWSFTVSGDLTNLHPGDTITITGSGLPAGTTLDVVLHSTPTDLGTVVAAGDGTFTQTDTIPDGVDLGAHTIQVTASGPGLVTTVQNQAITVTAKPVAGSGGKTNPVAPKPTVTHDNGGSANGSAIAPNILTRALTPLADVAVHPNKIVSAFEIGLVLLLLAVLPAHLLNATISEQSERFERRFGKIKTPNWMFRLGVWFRSAPVVGGVAVTLATAILFGFADPKFGFTLASLRLILACGIALFLVGYVANALTGLIARVQWNIVAAVSTRPYGLILTIVGVLISRLLHFSPGFLIGLILGLTLQGKSATGFAWRTVVLRSSIVLAMAIAAWIGYSTLTLGGNEGGTFGSALLVETLVAITTEGIVALLVELLPLRFLEGERVYAHSRVLWGIYYFLTLVVFVLAVVPWEGNWDALHSSLWIWIVVLAGFAAICVGIYIYFRRFAPPLEEEDGDEKVSLGETVSRDHS